MYASHCLNSMFIVVLIMGCFCSSAYTMEKVSDNIMEKVVSAHNSFGFNVFQHIVKENGEDNIFISPISLATALTMTYNGANGETKEAMAKILGLQGISLEETNKANAMLLKRLNNLGEDVLLEIANSLWARSGEEFRSDFLKRNEEFYDAGISTLDFNNPKAPSIINTWIREKTGGKIKEIVREIPSEVILYLIDAAYFKGAWAVKFDKQYTQERDFTLLDNSKKKVPMMMTSSKDFKYLKGDKFDAVALPYGDGKVKMYVFVPHKESGLKEFYETLSSESWKDWMAKFQQTELNIVMPRFSVEYEIILNNSLTKLGMGVVFRKDANFSGMCSGGGVWIDEVKQKTFLEVNEEGTEAMATAIVSMKKGPMAIYIDRPFFCVIRDDKTKAILFIGSIMDP